MNAPPITPRHKQVPLLAVLARLGMAAVSQAAGGNYYYFSPFTKENTPSFVACEPKNCWVDFTLPVTPKGPQGGDAVALLTRLYGLSVPHAKALLLNWAGELPRDVDAPAAGPAAGAAGPAARYDVRVEPLAYRPLLEYLAARGIDCPLVRREPRTAQHLVQVFYRVAGKGRAHPYFALGWASENGLELRSARYQSCEGGKGVTRIPGPRPGLVVFEGFMDYLSALTFFRKSGFDTTVLVLNSLTLLGQVLPELQAAPVVHWWGDNDAAGEQALDVVRHALAPGRLVAHNERYRGYKDVNDWLTKTPPKKPLPARRAAPSRLSQTAKWWIWAVFDEVDEARSRKLGRTEYKRCTFYGYTNDREGFELLLLLRKTREHGWRYHRLCERTQGRKYKILEWGGVLDAPPVTQTALNS